jgi:hypothetical protein
MPYKDIEENGFPYIKVGLGGEHVKVCPGEISVGILTHLDNIA